jgi:hypothetical protein
VISDIVLNMVYEGVKPHTVCKIILYHGFSNRGTCTTNGTPVTVAWNMALICILNIKSDTVFKK